MLHGEQSFPALVSLTAWAMLLFYLHLYLQLRLLRLGGGKGRLVLQGALLLLSFHWVASLLALMGEGAGILVGFPFLGTAFVLLLLTVAGAGQLRWLSRWNRTHISASSVKESLDTLPTGLAFYWQGGLPKLINTKMNELSLQLCGKPVVNGQQWWENLREGTLPGCIRNGEEPIYQLANGQVYGFSQYQAQLEGETLWELIASDITEEYCLVRELEEKKVAMDAVNIRLKMLSGTIKIMAMEKEALQTKIQIHDRIGHALLLAKQYLARPGAVNRGELIALWKQNISLLRHERPESWEAPYTTVQEQIAALGLKLRVQGKLPEEEHLRPLIENALLVHATNTLRHAGGNQMWITVCEQKETYELHFGNDGRRPERVVKERGGLQDLRRQVEAAGGTMKVNSLPAFELVLELPRKEE